MKELPLFCIDKTFQSVFRDGNSLKRMQTRYFLLEISSTKHSRFLLNCTKIGSFSVQAHKTLSTTRGVISESEILLFTKEELLLNLSDQDVIVARRIIIHRNRQVLLTKHIILSFNSPTLTTRIKADKPS